MPLLRHVRARDCALAAALILLTLVTFWSATHCGFVQFDDGGYPTNPHVVGGLTFDNVGWAMTTGEMSNWHPLTWMSLMLDVSLWGRGPAGFHATSVVIHAINAALLFVILRAMTAAPWRSAAAAALFSVHPLRRVESVAWIAERKDVLSTLFGLLAIGAYVLHTRKASRQRFAAVMVMMALSLMSKPMLVTLPGVLLLLDYWPLRRMRQNPTEIESPSLGALIVEKFPLAAISLLSCVATILAQSAGGSMATIERLPMGVRVGNAAMSCVAYLWKMILPRGLAVFYPHTGAQPIAIVAAAMLVLAGVTFIAWRRRQSSPWLVAGWSWYLLTLIPVIGLVQVGAQAMADRYTYVPMIGLAILAAWSLPVEWIERQNWRIASASACTLVVIIALCVTTHRQIAYWHDSVTLLTHAIDVTGDNVVAQTNLAVALALRGDARGARAHFLEAIRINPRSAISYDGLGVLEANLGDIRDAIRLFEKAVSLAPAAEPPCRNLAAGYTLIGRTDDAIALYRKSVTLCPQDAAAHEGLARLLSGKGDHAGAVEQDLAAIKARPDLAEPHVELGVEEAGQGRLEEAVGEFQRAVDIDPNDATARKDLARARDELAHTASADVR